MSSSFRLFKDLRKLRIPVALFSFLIAFASLADPRPISAESKSREYILKAAFIYNFTKFVKWPDGADSSMRFQGVNLCLTGEDPFGEILDELSQKLASKGKRLNIKRKVSRESLRACHILFISHSEQSQLKKIIAAVNGFPVLTIGDTPQFAQKGIAINFFIESNKIKFEINLEVLKRHDLKASSELLDLARIVRGD